VVAGWGNCPGKSANDTCAAAVSGTGVAVGGGESVVLQLTTINAAADVIIVMAGFLAVGPLLADKYISPYR
jgi:mannose/fructose/N-acetylgalactosamine-specific phosphotransferase system component IIC